MLSISVASGVAKLRQWPRTPSHGNPARTVTGAGYSTSSTGWHVRLSILLAYVGFVSLGLPDAIFGVAWPSVRGSYLSRSEKRPHGMGCGRSLHSRLRRACCWNDQTAA